MKNGSENAGATMKNNDVKKARAGRCWMCWGLVAIPLTGFALLMGFVKEPAVRRSAGRSAGAAPKPVATAASLEQPAPARVEPVQTAATLPPDFPRQQLADVPKTPPDKQRPVAVMPREQMLALRGTPDDVIELIRLYHEAASDEVRDEIFSAACTLSNPESAGLLFRLLAASGESDLTTAAALSLARMADSVLLDEILYRYETAATPAEQARLLGIIYQVRSPSRVPALIGMAERLPGGDASTAVLQTLGMIGSPGAVEYLLDRFLATGTPEEQAAYGEALSWVVEADALPLLISAATDGSIVSAARAAAARALGNFMPEYVESLLGSMVSTERDPAVRQAAQEALIRVRS